MKKKSTAKRYPIIDGHTDVITHVGDNTTAFLRAFLRGRREGHVDLPRLRKGNVLGAFFAVFFGIQPDNAQNLLTAFDFFSRMCRLEQESKGACRIVRTKKDLDHFGKDGAVSMISHLEGADVIDEKFRVLDILYNLGCRSIGLVWSRENRFGQGIGAQNTGRGLTPVGKKLIQKMEDKGMMIDVSHTNEKTFWDTLDIAKGPVAATHSNCRSIHNNDRNLWDDQLKAIAEKKGVVGINFCKCFLKGDGEFALGDIVRHIDHAVGVAGIDHVAFGSDFDGCEVPGCVKDVVGYNALLEELDKCGYSASALEKLCWKNWVRILKRTLKT